MNPAELHPGVWLALLGAAPLVFTLFCLALPSRKTNGGTIRTGNPLLKPGAIPHAQEPVLRPLLHLTRTLSDQDLRALILGLRHLPLAQTFSILRRYQHHPDPELQLHAQSILQEKQAALQRALTQLLPKAGADDASAASALEAALSLFASPLTPESEQAAILAKAFPCASAVLQQRVRHPRAVSAAARLFLQTGHIAEAQELLTRLESGSPLHTTLMRQVGHRASVLHPPEPLTASYQIQ